MDLAGNAREGRELVGGGNALRVGELVQKSGLADRGEADHDDARIARLHDIKAFAFGARLAGGIEQHLAEARQARLETANMVLGRCNT